MLRSIVSEHQPKICETRLRVKMVSSDAIRCSVVQSVLVNVYRSIDLIDFGECDHPCGVNLKFITPATGRGG